MWSNMPAPTGTTHVITSSIPGVGLTKRLSAVNWQPAYRILWAWVLTIPASGLVSCLTCLVPGPLFGK